MESYTAIPISRNGKSATAPLPYSFQGLETEGILDMVKAREATGMPIVSELMSEDRIPEFEEYVEDRKSTRLNSSHPK